MVYVQQENGSPLMPTERHGKVRRLLASGQAVVVSRTPFTIRLTYTTTEFVQPLTLGVDSGSVYVGLSVTSESKEYYAAQAELRTDIVKLLADRRATRRTRRNRLRYRAPRFTNRKASRKDGWLAPSIKNKVDTHLKLIQNVHTILPIKNIVIETASFDTQKIKNDKIQGVDYQNGEQLGFWNVREYVLFRDGHSCQHCKGKSKDKVLNVHHIESRQTGGNAPSNLITLCKTCHYELHNNKFSLSIKRGVGLRDAAVMGIMRWSVYNSLKNLHDNVSHTFGYITKNSRVNHGITKTHTADARCITGNPLATPVSTIFFIKQTRRHNRQIHKHKILKGNRKKRNQAPYIVNGFRLFDKVLFQKKECFIFGRRSSGSFDIRLLDGTKIHNGVSYKKLKLIEKRKSLLITKKEEQGLFLPHLKVGVSSPELS